MKDNVVAADTFNVTLEANPSALQRDQPLTLSARVTDEFSIPRVNELIDFYDETTGEFIGSDTTDNEGYATLVYTIPSDAELGGHLFRAEMSAMPEYNDTITVQILGDLSITLEITPDRQLKGSIVTLKATVIDNNSNPLPDALVNFLDVTDDFYVKTGAITDGEGVASHDWEIEQTRSVGLHKISAIALIPLSGEEINDNGTLEILNPFTIDFELSETDIERGETVGLNATVTDSLSSVPEVGVTVNFYDNDTLIGTADTDAQGLATFDYTVPLDADYGNHTIKVTVYEGDPNFSDAEKPLTVYMNATVNAAFSENTVTREDSIIVSVTVTDEIGTGLPDYTVELYDATINQVITSNVTDVNGQADLTYGIPVDSLVGEHNLVVRVVNVPQYVIANEVQDSLYVFANTDLHVELLVTEAEPGDTVEIIATLTDNILNGLEGYTIFFYAGDTLLGSQITDSNGIAVFQWLVDSSLLGQQQIRAEFVASGYYQSNTSNTENIDIHSNAITILNDLTVESGEEHTVKVRVTEDGESKANVNVKLYVEVDGAWVLVDEEQTDNDGEAELKMTVQDEIGTQKIRIVTDVKTKTATLKVKYAPDIDVDLDEGIEVGDTLDIKVTIKDYNGEPIRVKVSIYWNDDLLISEKTDEEGSIKTSITPDKIGEYEVKIKIDSISDAIVETIKKTVRVGEQISIEYEENPVNSSISVTLRHSDGTGIANLSLDVYVAGQGESSATSLTLQIFAEDDYYATINTDENGMATFSMKEFKDGTYTIKMVFYRSDIKESVAIQIETTVEQQSGGINVPLLTNLSDTSLIFSIVGVIGVCAAISGLMYYFFIRTPQPDPLASISELQSDYEIQGEEQMVDLNLVYQRPSFWISEMIDPIEFGVKAIFLVEFDIIMGPIIKEFRVFNEQTEFSSVIMDPIKLTSFYTMAVTRDQFKLEETNENIFVKLVTVSAEDRGIQGETIVQNLLVIVTEKEEYNENWVKHLIETLLVEWPDQQGYLAHQMDQFVPNIEMNIPSLL
ncbi:MAG: Ig-like domain repeat protein [Promethearchaeota archaeon]